MESLELLDRYASGRRDFRGVILHGQNFRERAT